MLSQALEQKFRAASHQDRRLIESLLETSTSLKNSVSEALSEILQGSTRGQFLSAVLEAAASATQGASVNTIHPLSSLDALVEVLTQPEALANLAPDDPLAIARLKGVQVKQRLLYEDGAPLKSEQVAQLLNMSRQAVDKRRIKHQLLGVSMGRRGYLYPLCQFQDHQVIPGLAQVLNVLKDFSPWTQLMFLKTGDVRLGGKTPLTYLQDGKIEDVLAAAECYGVQSAV